jgi:hypothetical protein
MAIYRHLGRHSRGHDPDNLPSDPSAPLTATQPRDRELGAAATTRHLLPLATTAEAAKARSALLAVPHATLERLEIDLGDRATSDGDSLASARGQAVLSLEIAGMCDGRPRIDRNVRELIRRMSRENPLWGSPHIQAK